MIWLTNTPPSGYENAMGEINYVANNLYTKLKNTTVYPFISSLFEVDGVKYVPISPSDRTCDAIDCAYNNTAEKIHIGEKVSYKGVEMTVKEVKPYTCYANEYIKNVELGLAGAIGDCAFKDCNPEQTSIVIPNSITRIGNDAFAGWQNLTSVSICCPVVGSWFKGSTSIKEVTLGEKVSVIEDNAFSDCTNLQSIEIPDDVTSIGNYAFQNCYSMSTIKIGNSVINIGRNAFKGCSAINEIFIPKSVQTINDNVFKGCTSLNTVIMEDKESELTLGSNDSSPLFADCPLDSVYIGRNITYPTSKEKGYSPFYRNTSLRSVMITDKETEISENEFYGCANLKNVSIGDGVTTIGNWAFSGCSSLDYFSFGSSVKSIGTEAFSDCTAMTKLISLATTPPTCGNQALDDINKWECSLSVPKGCTPAYQMAEQWKEFFFVNDDASGIKTIVTDSSVPYVIYDLNGSKKEKLQRGINIIKYSKGTVKNVIQK